MENDPGQQTAAQAGVPACPSCGTRTPNAPTAYVYALGRIEPRFPRISVEKEYAQATGRAETAGLTDREALHKILSNRENRYLVKQLCWVLTIEGMEAYFLQPRDPADFDLLVEALRPTPRLQDIDVVVGIRGPTVPPDFCNGIMAPIAAFSQLYSFDIDSFIKAIPRAPQMAEKDFPKAAEELFLRLVQIADNTGTSDQHRALNYLVLRYPAIYAKAAEEFAHDFSLAAVDVQPSALTSARKVVEVVFSFTSRTTDFTEKFFVRVDVTEEFPFLVTKLSPYYDR
jgi:hypothetical protein